MGKREGFAEYNKSTPAIEICHSYAQLRLINPTTMFSEIFAHQCPHRFTCVANAHSNGHVILIHLQSTPSLLVLQGALNTPFAALTNVLRDLARNRLRWGCYWGGCAFRVFDKICWFCYKCVGKSMAGHLFHFC